MEKLVKVQDNSDSCTGCVFYTETFQMEFVCIRNLKKEKDCQGFHYDFEEKTSKKKKGKNEKN